MQRYVICGATGFIGRNILEHFARLFPGQVVGVYNKTPSFDFPGISWIKVDLRDAEAVGELIEESDVVVQAAATTSGAKDILERPYIHTTDNAILNSLLLRTCYERNAKHFIFFSCTVMYPTDLNRAITENDFCGKINHQSPHFGVGWTKVYIEKMCEFYAKLGRTKHTVIRHSNIYGPYDKYDLEHSHMYGATVSKVMQAKDNDAITVWGNGEESRDLLYVDEVVDFTVRALKQKSAYELINVGCGRPHQVNDVVEQIIATSGKNISIKHDLTKPNIPSKIWLDCAKAKNMFGWESKISLAEGTERTIQWYKKNMRR